MVRTVPRLKPFLLPVLLIACLAIPDRATAEVRRALLVGIDQYATSPAADSDRTASKTSRRLWTNLQGSVNDVQIMREVLIRRFGFNSADILVLTNQQATRANILSAFRRHLIDPVGPGDLSIVFYAGHGSRIYNSNSPELDRRDETIVPADANSNANPAVIVDIRDKEWDRLFTQVLDRGAKLTAIFDSCHSGSISRGLAPMTAAVRSLDEDERDVALLIGPEPPAHPPGQEPERREGALIVSASQEDQPAREAARRFGDRKEWHGAFTLALVDTLNELPSTATAQRIFDQVTARLKAGGYNQDPELSGSPVRRHGPLFGGSFESEARPLRLNVVRAQGPEQVQLQGGAALGLTPGTELIRAPGTSNRAPLRLRITKLLDLLASQAMVIQGAWTDLRPGDEFELVHHGQSQSRPLRLWLPPVIEDATAVLRLASDVRSALPSTVIWVEDPTVTAPTHVIYWNGKEWIRTAPSQGAVALGSNPTAAQVLSSLTDTAHSALFFNVPPSRAFRTRLTSARTAGAFAAEITNDADEADYVLVGRAVAGHSEHAWALRAFSHGVQSHTRAFPLPVRTAWGSEKEDETTCQAGGLRDCIARLSKLHHWLTIPGPEENGRFPYRLGFESLTDQKIVTTDVLPAGPYRLVLQGDQASIDRVRNTWGIQTRYVYVFVIDEQGRSTLLFPNEETKDKENLLPTAFHLKQPSVALSRIDMGESGIMSVHGPYGSDTYIMMTSARPIPRFKELVESEPVAGQQDPLRGQEDWSIDRQFLRSIPVVDR